MMIAGRLNRQPMDRPMKPFGLTTADMIAWIVRIGLGTLFGKYQVYPRTLGITLMGISLIWIGIVMLAS